MARLVEVIAHYEGDADEIFRAALDFQELQDAMAGLATYKGFPESAEIRAGDTYRVDVTFWGFLTVKGHVIEVVDLDVANRIIRSHEYAPGVKRWDHTLSVQPVDGRVQWSDRIEIDAGWRSGFMARFAAYMYARRHRHRAALSVSRRISKL